MAIITIDGFEVYSNLDGTKDIIVDSDHIDECMKVFVKNNLDGVAVTTSHNYRRQDIDFLSDYPEIKQLSVSDGIGDVDAIRHLTNLTFLMLSGKNRKVDFENFPVLTNLIADWSPNFLNMDSCKQLSQLTFHHYTPKIKDCSSLANVPWVKRLEITQSPIKTLNGLDNFSQLEELEMNYCGKLETLCCLNESKTTLLSSRFNHCKSIKNHEYVVRLDCLNTLGYSYCGTIPSVKFIEKMRSLQNFMFVGTDVSDGDISPCIGLEYIGFTDKKHFSHTMKQINELSKIAKERS
jgi:protein phosphatase 1 regulatory subunit 7